MTDIDDEGHGRLQSGDVCKVLFRRHTKINAPGLHALQEIRKNLLKGFFVRHVHFEGEVAAGFRVIGDYFPEVLIAERRRQRIDRVRGQRRNKDQRKRDGQNLRAHLPTIVAGFFSQKQMGKLPTSAARRWPR